MRASIIVFIALMFPLASHAAWWDGWFSKGSQNVPITISTPASPVASLVPIEPVQEVEAPLPAPQIIERVVVRTVDNPEHIRRINNITEQVNNLFPLVQQLKEQITKDRETIERLEGEVEYYKSKLQVITEESESSLGQGTNTFETQAARLFETIYEDVNLTNRLCRQDHPFYNIFAPFDAFCKKYQDVQKNSRG
jgi:archaellum component FlaC